MKCTQETHGHIAFLMLQPDLKGILINWYELHARLTDVYRRWRWWFWKLAV